jgi:hypothetical protein
MKLFKIKSISIAVLLLLTIRIFAQNSDIKSGREKFLLSAGCGVSFGNVELYDGENSFKGGEIGYSLNMKLGWYLSNKFSLFLSLKSLSQMDDTFFSIIPDLCIIASPGFSFYLKKSYPSFFISSGLGIPADGLAINSKGVIGGFIGSGYEFSSLFYTEIDALLGIYDSGHTFAIIVTLNINLF